ncbi:MAG: hypothetical protein GXO31_04605 [Epsilonproteobacteria bacterium]|nr:hypothetical protein [Campylobacterota bacterium]
MAVFIYLSLIFLIIFVELSRKKYFTFDFMTSFNFFFLISYAITPLILVSSDNPFKFFAKDMIKGVYYYGLSSTPYLIAAAYLAFLAGYYNKFFRSRLPILIIEPKFDEKAIIRLSPIFVLTLSFLLFVYIMQFGGVKEALMAAEAYRGGDYEPPKYGFVQRFFPANTVLLYYSYYKYFLDKECKNKTPFLFLFIFSFSFFIFLFFLFNSRGYLIIILGGMYLITSIVNKRYYITQVLILSIVGILIIQVGDPLFYALPDLIDNGWDSFVITFTDIIKEEEQTTGGFEEFVSNFTHPVVSLDLSLQRSGFDIPFRYLSDLWISILSLLPDKLVGFKDPLSVSNINTILNKGVLKGTVLVGILGYFSYALGVIGVILGMFFYGVLGGYLSRFFYQNAKFNKTVLVFAYFFIFYYGYFVFRGDPKITLQELFILLFIIFVILIFSKIYIQNPTLDDSNKIVLSKSGEKGI